MQPTDLLIKLYDNLSSKLSPLGWLEEQIQFILEVDHSGRLVAVIETDKTFFVPACDTGRTSGVRAYTLWDKRSYIFGDLFGVDPKLNEHQQAFVDKVRQISADVPKVIPILKFMQSGPANQLRTFLNSPLLTDTKDINKKCIFRLVDDTEVTINTAEMVAYCGVPEPADFAHNGITGIPGTSSAGAKLVSYNTQNCEHYKLDGNQHNPMGYVDMLKYSAVLQYLVRNQFVRTGDNTGFAYFSDVWDDSGDVDLVMSTLFGYNPDATSARSVVEAQVKAIYTGKFATTEGNIYVINMRGNNGRIAILSCEKIPYKQLSTAIEQWASTVGKSVYQVLQMLGSPGAHVKSDIIKSILTNTKIPQYLENMALARLKNPKTTNFEHNDLVNFVAYSNKQELQMSNNVIYGRIFALYCQLQEMASDGPINAPIAVKKIRQLGINPKQTIAEIASKSQYWISKISKSGNAGGAVYVTKQIDELMDMLGGDGPVDLFEIHLGISQQRKIRYTKKTEAVE